MTDYIFFGILYWHDRKQRPQQIPEHLAKIGHRVIYIEPILQSNVGNWFSEVCSIGSNLRVCKLSTIGDAPNPYTQCFREEQGLFSAFCTNKIIEHYNLQNPILVAQIPFWETIFKFLPMYTRIYDCMDDHEDFENNNIELTRVLETNLIKSVDGVITSSLKLFNKFDIKNKGIIRNGVNLEAFKDRRQTNKSNEVTEHEVNKIGYFGAVDHWFDVDLFIMLVKLRPDLTFEIIGNINTNFKYRFEGIKNLKLFGEVEHNKLADIIKTWRVGVIPFKLNNLILATNPVKAYEFACMGIPVVATKIPELYQNPEFTRTLADNVWEFSEAINHYLEDKSNEVMLRSEWAEVNSWDERCREFENFCAALNSQLDTTIIILHYGEVRTTFECLDSIYEHYNNSLKIILVNNGCDIGLSTELKNFGYDKFVTLKEPKSNLGFAKGVNYALKFVETKYILLLNNDAKVTSGFLKPLKTALDKNRNIKIAAPASDKSGNEAFIPFDITKELMDKLILFRMINYGNVKINYSLSFFCILIEKNTFELLGILDEGFEIGMFEDDDYVRRIQNSGFEVGICYDSYVFHKISSSFNLMNSEERNRIFLANKKIYEKKWGPWNPHKYLKPLPDISKIMINQHFIRYRVT
jgi:GT2 family glycosyltransferase/glycosyltransferase involved in cell wall biosynthesis